MTGLGKAYESRRPALRRARAKLKSILRRVAAEIDDRDLVRAEVRPLRIKQLSSIRRKVKKNGWSEDAALNNCSDLIGGRVVCNNLADVFRFAELLKEELLGYLEWFEVQDQIRQPNNSGYRALHVNLRINVGEHPFNPDLVPCEVQIRTRLQDAWAELAHDDIYRQPDLPEDLRARATDLAEVLAAADKIAGDIRLRAMREFVPPDKKPDLRSVSAEALAFVFRDVFGRSPADYTIKQALNSCDSLDIATLEDLPRILARSEFRETLADAYRDILKMPPGNDNIFLTSLHALARDDKAAVKYIKRQARREWREIDQIASREMLSSLPETVGEAIEAIESGSDVTEWAEALGATSECAICGTTIVPPDTFAEAIVHHYELSDPEATDASMRIEQALLRSGTETG